MLNDMARCEGIDCMKKDKSERYIDRFKFTYQVYIMPELTDGDCEFYIGS